MTDGDLLVVLVGGARRSLPVEVVREVASLGNLTPVPTAPEAVRGVTQVRGQILPVVTPGERQRAPRLGDPLVVVDAGGVRAALAVEEVVGMMPASGAAPERLDVGPLLRALTRQ